MKMYDNKIVEFGQQPEQQQQTSIQHENCHNKNNNKSYKNSASNRIGSISQKIPPPSLSFSSSLSLSTSFVITSPRLHCRTPTEYTHTMTLLSIRRRRLLQRHTCMLSILAAFVFGMTLGVFMPKYGLANIFTTTLTPSAAADKGDSGMDNTLPVAESIQLNDDSRQVMLALNRTRLALVRLPSDFPTIHELGDGPTAVSIAPPLTEAAHHYSIAFIREQKMTDPSLLDAHNERYHRDDVEGSPTPVAEKFASVSRTLRSAKDSRYQRNEGIVKADIYWGDMVERAMPLGFSSADSTTWNSYVNFKGVVKRLEEGCGRMQNRMIIFADGTRACARYRQNTDQIQGEIFSFFLGQLLNLTNLAPSAASLVDLERPMWFEALADVTHAQWKQQRPVILTRWLPDLEPAGIPLPFRPQDRHLNKHDVWNITRGINVVSNNETQSIMLQRLVELAQWSDLIIFDYLIANLDRVVNNLYNHQWNADIMAAPAHNLVRNSDSQLLIFLDNESGLLHGYRLLKKYESYHSLLLDNLCIFRQPTIDALRQLRLEDVGQRLRDLYDQTMNATLRDVLPMLPSKSIKILIDRIDHVLNHVHKCSKLLADS